MMPVIDADEIGRAHHLSAGDAWTQGNLRALDYLVRRESFCIETTLAGRDLATPSTYLRMMEDAKDLGYRVELFFLGAGEPQRHVERVEERVALGLHDVPRDVIVRKHHASMARLPRALKLADRAVLVDNAAPPIMGPDGARAFEQVLETNKGRLAYIAGDIPEWASRALGPSLPALLQRDRMLVEQQARNLLGPVAREIGPVPGARGQIIVIGAAFAAVSTAAATFCVGSRRGLDPPNMGAAVAFSETGLVLPLEPPRWLRL